MMNLVGSFLLDLFNRSFWVSLVCSRNYYCLILSSRCLVILRKILILSSWEANKKWKMEFLSESPSEELCSQVSWPKLSVLPYSLCKDFFFFNPFPLFFGRKEKRIRGNYVGWVRECTYSLWLKDNTGFCLLWIWKSR